MLSPCDRLAADLALQPKDYPAQMGFDAFTINGMSGTIQSFEAPGKSNVAWCSALSMSDGAANARCSVTGWVGPLSDVPHLVASAGISNGGIDLFIDFRPRADCAYNPTGVYPEPDTREAFAMGGNRKDFAAAFFTDEMVAWRAALCNLPGAVRRARTAKTILRPVRHHHGRPLMLRVPFHRCTRRSPSSRWPSSAPPLYTSICVSRSMTRLLPPLPRRASRRA